MKRPSFQFYPADLLSDTEAMCMPNEALGMYFKLLCFDWVNDGIPSEKKIIMRMVGFDWHDFQGEQRDPQDYDILLSYLYSKFIAHPSKKGFLTNPRLLKERQKQDEFLAAKERAGRIGAEKRWNKAEIDDMAEYSTPIDLPLAKNASSSTTSSPSNKEKINKKKKVFTPPSLLEVESYFVENRYSQEAAKKAWDYYESAKWVDSRGNKVLNWKQKMISVWFKEENKIKPEAQKRREAIGRNEDGTFIYKE